MCFWKPRKRAEEILGEKYLEILVLDISLGLEYGSQELQYLFALGDKRAKASERMVVAIRLSACNSVQKLYQAH